MKFFQNSCTSSILYSLISFYSFKICSTSQNHLVLYSLEEHKTCDGVNLDPKTHFLQIINVFILQESRAKERMFSLKRCFKGWWNSLPKNRYLRRSAHMLHPMFYNWCLYTVNKKYRRKKFTDDLKKLSRRMVYRRFIAYVNIVKERKRIRGLITRVLSKYQRRLLMKCFQSWISFMQVIFKNQSCKDASLYFIFE